MNNYFTYTIEEINRCLKDSILDDFTMLAESISKMIKNYTLDAIYNVKVSNDNKEILLCQAYVHFVSYLYDYGKKNTQDNKEENNLKYSLIKCFDYLVEIKNSNEFMPYLIDTGDLKIRFGKLHKKYTNSKATDLFEEFYSICLSENINPAIIMAMFMGIEKQ